jgi:hypothetical protein
MKMKFELINKKLFDRLVRNWWNLFCLFSPPLFCPAGQLEIQPTNSTFGFFQTHKSNLKKPKELFFCKDIFPIESFLIIFANIFKKIKN